MCLLAFLRGNGTVFPRRRLQFFFLRRKRHSIPAQKGTTGCPGRIWQPILARKGATGCSGRIWRIIPAQNFICWQSARVGRAIPAQAATFFRSRRIWRLIPARATKKKLTQKVSFAVYFLKYVLLLNLLIIADQNLHQKSFSHQNPLYIPFLLQGICP